MLDIIFLSYDEPNADRNWALLKLHYPHAIRVHGVKGIHEAHKVCAETAMTKMFYVVDGDAEILNTFKFRYTDTSREIFDDTVYTWRSINEVNGLEYGYGGVKLMPRKYLLNNTVEQVDFATNIAPNYMSMGDISNINRFATSPFQTWRSAFRECAKLQQSLLVNYNIITQNRLSHWCMHKSDHQFDAFCRKGANQGLQFALDNKTKPENMKKLNDFGFLKEIFDHEHKHSA